MLARLIALAAAILLFIWPMQPTRASIDDSNQGVVSSDLDLPSALIDDDSFNELPFEQLRQALREEVEREPGKTFTPHSPTRYNFLIR